MALNTKRDRKILFPAPFGSRVASALVAGSDLLTLLSLEVMSHPWGSPYKARLLDADVARNR